MVTQDLIHERMTHLSVSALDHLITFQARVLTDGCHPPTSVQNKNVIRVSPDQKGENHKRIQKLTRCDVFHFEDFHASFSLMNSRHDINNCWQLYWWHRHESWLMLVTGLRRTWTASKTKVREDVDILRTPGWWLKSNIRHQHLKLTIGTFRRQHRCNQTTTSMSVTLRRLRRNVGLSSGSGFPDYCRVIKFREFFPDSTDLLC